MTSNVEGVKKSRKSQLFRGVNKIYSFKALKTGKAEGTTITLGHAFVSSSEKSKALDFRRLDFFQSDEEFDGKQGAMLIFKNDVVLQKSSIYIHELSNFDEEEVLIAPWTRFKIVNYYYKYDYCGSWKEARTDREIHTLLEMDNGTAEANNVRERWQYIELEAFI